MKKLLVFLLSAIMAVCMCGFAVTHAEGNPVTLELPAALGAGDNCFTAEVSPSLYTAEGQQEYEIAGADLSSVVISDGTSTATITHFRNEPAMGRMKFYNTHGFMNFQTAAKGSTITFKAGTTFADKGATYTFGDTDVVYECDGNGNWLNQTAERVTLTLNSITPDTNMFRLAVSPSLYAEEGAGEYDIASASLSSVILSNGTSTASVTHFRNEPAMGCMKFYDTNNFMNFRTAAAGSTITFKANTLFADHNKIYTFGKKDVIFECDGNGVWTKKDESEIPERFTTEVLSESEVNLPAYGDNSVSFDNDKISFNLTKDTAQNVSSYDASVTLNRIYEGDFTTEFKVSDKSSGHTGDRFLIFAVGESNSFMYLPYQNENVYLLNGANYDAGLGNTLHKQAISGDLTVKFQRIGNELTLYVNGEQFGETQQYTAKTAKFTVKVRRLVVEVSDISVLGTQAEAPVTKQWTSDDFADSVIDVPEFENNSVTVGENKLCINLSNNADPGDLTKQATVSFNKKYQDDFALEFNVDYKSTNYAQQRYLMVTFGNSYSLVFIPSYAQVHLIGGVDFKTGATVMNMSDAELSAASIKVVRSGNSMTFYINGSQFGTTQTYTEEFVKIGVKAHRVVADIINFRVTGAEYVETVEEWTSWTTEDLEDSDINVPEFETNSVSAANDKLAFDLSNNATATDFTKEATVSFNKEFIGDFKVEYTLNYLSVSNSGPRYLMFTVGDAYALMYCPYNADVQLLGSTAYDTKRLESMAFSANSGTFRVVRSGNELSFYVNGDRIGAPQTYTAETAKFGFKAHRVTAEVVDLKTQGTVKEIPVNPDDGKTFVEWTGEDFDDSVKHVPDYDGNSITVADDKLTISLSKDTDQNSSAYDSSVVFNKVYEGDFTLEFTLKYLSADHAGLRYVMFMVGGYGIAYCPYCEKIHFYKGTQYHGDGLIEEPEFKGVTEFRFRVVVENGKLGVKVNDASFTAQDYAEQETAFGFNARRTISEISAWKIAGSVKTPGNAVSTDVFRFVTVTGAENPTFVVNRNLGATAFATENADLSAVKYVAANGQKVAVTSVNYSFAAAGDMMPSLIFLTSAKPAVGDKITVNAGFSFMLNGEKISTTKTYVAEYTENGWTGVYATAGETVSVSTGTITVDQYASSDAIVIDFGLTGVKGGSSYFDDATSGWHQYDHTKAALRVYEKFAATAMLVRDGKRIPARYVLSKGKFAFAGVSGLRAGDGIILLKGLTVYEMNEANYNADMGMVRLEESYAPVFVLSENIVYRYDGTNFVKESAATSATIVNEDELNSLHAGTISKILWRVNDGAVDYPKFSSDNEEVATVDGEGNITTLKAGRVTFTLAFTEITKTITITVGEELAKTGIGYELATSAKRDGKSYFVAYLGEELDIDRLVANLNAYWIMDGGVNGTEFVVTKDMIDASMFNNSVEGETKVALTNENLSVEILVYVYEVKTVDDISPSRLVSFGNAVDVYFIDSVGGSEVTDVKSFNIIENPLYGIPTDIVTIRKAALDGATEYALHSVGQVSNLQFIMFFNEFDMSKKNEIPVGTVLSFNKSFRFWRHIDETWVATYKFKNTVDYVWTGAEWTYFESDATEITVSETTLTLPVGAEYAPEYSVLPENSYYKPALESSDSSVATIENGKIKAVGKGNAVISLRFGSRKRDISLTVVEKEIVGVKLVDDRIYNVSLGGKLDLSKISFYADYGDGIYGEAIALTDENASYSLDTSVAGKQTIEMVVTVGGKQFSLEVSVTVWNVEEVYPDNIACNDDAGWFMGTTIGIFFQKTFGNMANVYPTDLAGDEGKYITDYVTYTRAGQTVTVDSQAFLTYIFAITPKIDGTPISTYLVGDVITLKKGMGFYKWIGGTDANNVPQGSGDFVKVGELKYDMTFTYNENGKFFLEIPVSDAKVLEETVSLGMGETHATNVVAIPSYCSNAEWFFDVADKTVASVNAQGLIKGLKIGSTKVTATLKTIAGDTIKTLTYTVSVTDSVSGIIITSDKAVELTKGESFDFASVKERFGIKAVILMVSGAKGQEVDLSGARITGYDPEKVGEQTLTFRITVDGKSVTGELKVTVKEAKSGGCGSSVDYGALALAVLLPLAFITVKKKGENYAD